MSARTEFVKSATTATPVAKSQGDIIVMLARYGASGFGFRRTGSIVEVTFHIPRDGATDHTIVIPVDINDVFAKLQTPAVRAAQKAKKKGTSADQAERVAWRVLYLWIDAALAAVSIGAQSLTDAFLAHVLVTDAAGDTRRVADHMAGALGTGTMPRRLGGAA